MIYRLSDNGWSAIRLVQHGTAILGEGGHALAAVGRQLFALDQRTRGEPTRLVQAPGNIVPISDRWALVDRGAGYDDDGRRHHDDAPRRTARGRTSKTALRLRDRALVTVRS